MEEGKLIWITGLSGAGKTTLAKLLYQKLKEKHPHTIHLDGDSMRAILGEKFKFNIEDRLAAAYIYSRMGNFLVKQGMNVIISTISLFHEIHDSNSKNNRNYYEIFLKVEEEELLKRNKRLYAQGKQVMGVDQTAEFPRNPILILDNNYENQLIPNVDKMLEILNLKI